MTRPDVSYSLRLHLECDDERVNRQGLDERQAENQWDEDLARCVGVTSDALEGSGRCATLTHAAAERCDADGQTGGKRAARDRGGLTLCVRRILCESGRRESEW